MEPKMNDNTDPNINSSCESPSTSFTSFFNSYIGLQNVNQISGKIGDLKAYGYSSYDAIAQPAHQVVQKTGALMGQVIDMSKGVPVAVSSAYSLGSDYIDQNGKSIGRNMLTIAANKKDIINQSVKTVIQACPDEMKEKSKEIGLKVGDGLDLTEGAITLLNDVCGDYIPMVKPLASGVKTLNTASKYLLDRKGKKDPKKFFMSTVFGESQHHSESGEDKSKL